MRAFVLLLSLNLHTSGDRWFAADKVKHFFMSAFVQSVSYAALRTVRVDRDPALVGSSAMTLAVGVGKEVHDAHTSEGFSVRDLTWDLAGATAAAAVLRETR